MPTAAGRMIKRATRHAPKRAPTRQPKRAATRHTDTDALSLLKADHRNVKALFAQFKKLKRNGAPADEKEMLVRSICQELRVHTALEEEIFYPAVREQIDDDDLMDEALVEHSGAKEMIDQLEDASPQDDLYDAKVTVLSEEIDHHVKEEEGNMFKQIRRAKVDTAVLGEAMMAMKRQLAPSTDEVTTYVGEVTIES